MEDRSSGAPADWLIKLIKKQYADFKKTKYTAPVAIGITAVLHYLMLTYMLGSCWLGLLPPFIMFGLMWNFDIKRVRRLLVYGFIGCTVLLVISTVFLVSLFQAIEPIGARSSETDPILYDGYVDPISGDTSTLFTYSITAKLTNESWNVSEVCVLIKWVDGERNETMDFAGSNASSMEYYYVYQTIISEPYNVYEFRANISGMDANHTWIQATDFDEAGQRLYILGPISSDPWSIGIWVLRYITVLQTYTQFFPIFAIICGMIWWIRRARRMRVKALQEWEKKRQEMEAKAPVDDTRGTPSMARAMGLEKEPDTFVCSECGADVPADAKTCQSCGEKFD